MSEKSLVLASGSPRRKDFLDLLGVNYSIVIPEINEEPLPGESAEALVLRLAISKAKAVAETSNHQDLRILGSDTVVVLKGQILGKPEGSDDAFSMLESLQGNKHQVIGGIALLDESGRVVKSDVVVTEVELASMSKSEIERYIATGESMDKAGSYAIQGLAMQYVSAINGSYTNVVGLDLQKVANWLKHEGFL